MSSSLFYDCYAPYETYAHTEYIDNDVRFGELKKGDKLYCIDCFDKIREIIVSKSWHEHKGHCCISTTDKYFKVIDFGDCNCWNVCEESYNNSTVFFNNTLIGTNRKSVLNTREKAIKDHLNKVSKKLDSIQKRLDEFRKLYKNTKNYD